MNPVTNAFSKAHNRPPRSLKSMPKADKKKADLDMWGVEKSPEKLFVQYVATLIHHGLAGLLMHIGLVTQATWIWRHGLLVQLAGCDVLDFLRIAWCVFFPPGPFPTREAMKTSKFAAFVGFHHSVSLLAGLPTTIYFADQPQFQFMGVLLAGYPMCLILFDLAAKCAPPEWIRFNALSEVMMSVGFCYQRIYMFFPLAVELLYLTIASEIPAMAKVSLALGGFSMSMFNLMMLMMVTQSVTKLVRGLRGQPDEEKAPVTADGTAQDEQVRSTAKEEVSAEGVSGLPHLLRKRQRHEKQLKAPFLKASEESGRHSDSDTTCSSGNK
eukprot:TRINITY_DN4358_c0_g1_i2.p1 TRINITY_DN4358_c0_g1~~TRINITY_DN4358_c0_g1_i2.p1  ORF type:complete len:326 (-),score=57.98 TRINITY_DN4358_c0_g1_i2:423-1400(-)